MAEYNRNNYDKPAYTSGKWQKPEHMKSLASFILLMVFTLGIYFLYWVYKTTEYANRDETEKQHSPVAQLLLVMFVPYYELYWFYKTSKKIEHLGDRVGVSADNAIATLVLAIFGLDFIGAILLQDSINKIEAARSGANISANGQGVCKSCGATFPNDAQACPACGQPYRRPFTKSVGFAILLGVLGLLLIGALLVGGISALRAGSDFTEEEWNEIGGFENILEGEDVDSANDLFTENAEEVRKNDEGRWALMDGDSVDTSFTGVAENEYGLWYIVDGYVDFNFSGTLEGNDGTVYTIENGKVVNQQ